MSDDGDTPDLDLEELPIVCSKCANQMRLFGIEWDTKHRDVYTFVCDVCGHAETRGVQAQ
jgi:hypothetical protein